MQNPDTLHKINRVSEFVSQNIVESDNSSVACGDGRFTPEQSKGVIRMFGGDEGGLMAIKGAANKLGIDIDIPQLVLKYREAVNAIRGEDSVLRIHTDAEHKKEGKIGCGHINCAIKEHIHEFLTPQETKEIHDEILKGEYNETVLEGEHGEKGVFLVHSKDYSVNSSNGLAMNFVVDVDRAKDFLSRVTEKLNIEGLTTEAVLERFMAQMEKTAEQLAGGLTMFDIAINGPHNFHVKESGIVPKAELVN